MGKPGLCSWSTLKSSCVCLHVVLHMERIEEVSCNLVEELHGQLRPSDCPQRETDKVSTYCDILQLMWQ